ncbi:MAG: hypothetical protein ABIS92_17985 [Polyangia bacterium]
MTTKASDATGAVAPVSQPVLLTAAATSLGIALQILDGRLQVFAVLFLAMAFVGATRGVLGRPLATIEHHGPALVDRVLGWSIAGFLVAHVIRFPSEHFKPTHLWMYVPFYLGLALVGLMVRQSFRSPQINLRRQLLLVVAVHVAMGGFLLLHAPEPPIDVFIFQRDSSAALLSGQNPYALTFPNIYVADTPYYGPGMVSQGRVLFGFVYMPISLLLILPGHLLGDFRFSHLAAMAVTALLMGTARPGRTAFLAAVLYLFHPRNLYVLSLGWTEPLVVALLALVVFCACRWRRGLPIAIGLLLVSKQYLVFAVPPLLLLGPTPLRWRDLRLPLAKAVAAGAVVSLPLALWDWRAFGHSVVTLQFHQPFREDALSFLAALAWLVGHHPPTVLAFIAAGGAIELTRRRCPHTPYGYSAAMAMVFFALFAFNKQAFCNYYHFVLGALCLAIAVWPAAPSTHQPLVETRGDLNP